MVGNARGKSHVASAAAPRKTSRRTTTGRFTLQQSPRDGPRQAKRRLRMVRRRRRLFFLPFSPLSGGAGIRTPVRDWIDHSVYVRIPSFRVSGNWPAGRRFQDKPPVISPGAGRRSAGLARYCDTHEAASGGLLHGQAVTRRLRSQCQVVVGSCDFPEGFTRAQDLGTLPQLHRPRRSQVAPVGLA